MVVIDFELLSCLKKQQADSKSRWNPPVRIFQKLFFLAKYISDPTACSKRLRAVFYFVFFVTWF